MRVNEVMTQNPIVCDVSDTASTIAGLMRENRIGGIPVMENGHLAGIITETDVLQLLNVDGPSDDLWLPSPLEIIELPIREFVNWEKTKKALTDIGAIPARDIMKHPVITVTPDMDVERAAEIMLNHSINRLVVIDKEKVVGILTRQDIVWSVGK